MEGKGVRKGTERGKKEKIRAGLLREEWRWERRRGDGR